MSPKPHGAAARDVRVRRGAVGTAAGQPPAQPRTPQALTFWAHSSGQGQQSR